MELSVLRSILLILVLSYTCVVSCETIFAVVIDAGSTGSRSYVVQVNRSRSDKQVMAFPGMKIKPGLSTFVDNLEGLGPYFSPLMSSALNEIPAEYVGQTELHIRGTAGMRLLPEEIQIKLWDGLYSQLVHQKLCPFRLKRSNLGTITGKMEAYYAVLSANYISRRIDDSLKPVNGSRMLGALDMGGSSTQLIFHTGTDIGHRVQQEHFWSHSWLSFGAERIQERVWKLLTSSFTYADPKCAADVASFIDVSDVCAGNCPACRRYFNPCMFKGHTEAVSLIDGVVLKGSEKDLLQALIFEGSGNATACAVLVENVLWPETNGAPGQCKTASGSCEVDGVVPPEMDDLHFIGMSAYYYALDCVRQLGPDSIENWPSPSINELRASIASFCAMDWGGTGANLVGRHAFTADEKLPYRCVEAVYIVTLLEYGFGFDASHRNFTLALEVDGTEVEWTLGYSLSVLSPAA